MSDGTINNNIKIEQSYDSNIKNPTQKNGTLHGRRVQQFLNQIQNDVHVAYTSAATTSRNIHKNIVDYLNKIKSSTAAKQGIFFHPKKMAKEKNNGAEIAECKEEKSSTSENQSYTKEPARKKIIHTLINTIISKGNNFINRSKKKISEGVNRFRETIISKLSSKEPFNEEIPEDQFIKNKLYVGIDLEGKLSLNNNKLYLDPKHDTSDTKVKSTINSIAEKNFNEEVDKQDFSIQDREEFRELNSAYIDIDPEKEALNMRSVQLAEPSNFLKKSGNSFIKRIVTRDPQYKKMGNKWNKKFEKELLSALDKVQMSSAKESYEDHFDSQFLSSLDKAVSSNADKNGEGQSLSEDRSVSGDRSE